MSKKIAEETLSKAEETLAKETLRKAERDLLICFVKGVILYRIAEETKQNVLKNWNREDFEEMLHAATKACNEMREGVDTSIEHVIDIVPEISAFTEELGESFKKLKNEEGKK